MPVRTARQLAVGYDPDTWSDIPGTPTGQFLTGDHNLVNVQLVLHYAIGETDAELDDFVMHQDQVDVVLDRVAEAAAGEWIAGRPVDQVLAHGECGAAGVGDGPCCRAACPRSGWASGSSA